MAYTYGSVTNCKVRNGQTRKEYECRLGYEVQSQSIENNTSSVKLRLECRSISSSYTTKGSSGLTSVIDGATVKNNASVDMSNTNTWQNFGERTITITHNANGTYSASKSGSFTCTAGSSNYSLSSGSASVTVKPATIPRASTPTLSASSVAMGSSVTINTNRVSDSFNHTITYKFGSATGTIASGVGDSTHWKPVLDLANQVPNGREGTCEITCQTYNGSNLVGTKTTTLKLIVPDTVKPVINSVTISEGGTAVPSNWGVYVQGKSSLKVVTDAKGTYGSTITAYKITGIDNVTYNKASFTSAILQEAVTYKIKVVVTDSRTRTAEEEVQVTCVAYSNPSISTATVTRCNSDGTANEEGTYVKYNFKANVASVSSKNTYSYKLGYKNSTSSSYTYITISNSAYTLDKSNVVISGVTFSVDNSYDFHFLVIDYFTKSEKNVALGTGFTLMDFNASGKGMAIGKVSEGNKLEVALPTELTDTIYCNKNSGDVYYRAKRTDSETEIAFGVGSGGINHGLWSFLLNKWMVYCDGTNVYLNGYASHITTGSRNTTDTYIPVINNGKLDYTLRKFNNGTGHTDYPNNQEYIATMEFLSYWNGAYNSNNNSNLKYCSDGTIQPKPTSLYDNSSGSNGTITLSETSANFSYIEIHGRSNDSVYFSQRVYNPNGKNVTLNMTFTTESAAAYLKNRLISISGTSITSYGTRYSETKFTNEVSTSTANNMYITKVVGYK